MRSPAHEMRDAADLITLGAIDESRFAGLADPVAAVLRLAAADFETIETMNTASRERAERLGGVDGQTYAVHSAWVGEAVKLARLILASHQ